MSFFASVRDKVYDQYGILDEAEDFYTGLTTSSSELKTQGAVLARLLEATQGSVTPEGGVPQLKSGHYRKAAQVVDGILDKMSISLKDMVRIERKARKDKVIWEAVSTKITTSKRHMQDAMSKARAMKTGISDMQRTQAASLDTAPTSMTKKTMGAIGDFTSSVLLASG